VLLLKWLLPDRSPEERHGARDAIRGEELIAAVRRAVHDVEVHVEARLLVRAL
jgi:hypothetical protein